MSATREGGLKTAARNKAKYGADYYSRIGKMGGQVKSPFKGFGTRRDLASICGQKGGRISKRTGRVAS